MAGGEGGDGSLRDQRKNDHAAFDDLSLRHAIRLWSNRDDLGWSLREETLLQVMGDRVARNESSILKPLVDAFIEVAGPYNCIANCRLPSAEAVNRFRARLKEALLSPP